MKALKALCLTSTWLLIPLVLRAAAGTGLGLCADYYDDVNFGRWAGSAADTGALNYDWAGNSPVAALHPDYFSIVWQGEIQAQFSETYVIYFRNDDGGRVYLNKTLILDNMLPPHAVQETATAVAMSAGVRLPIRVEMYENAGLAVAQLSWSSPSTPKQIVPASQLYCIYPGVPTPTPSPTPWAPLCLQGDSFAGPALQPFWADRQIGLGLTGTASLAGSLSFTASGISVSDSSDGFRYIYQQSGGDFDVSLKVDFVGSFGANSRAGLMARESLDTAARYAAVFASNQGVFRWQTRTAQGALAGNFSGGAFVNSGLSPAWLRLRREGDLFGAYSSPDGMSWSQLGLTETVSMPANLLIGIAALSGSGGVLRSVKVEDFRPYGCGLAGVTLELYDSAGTLALRTQAGLAATGISGLRLSAQAWDPGLGRLHLSSGSWDYDYDGRDSSGQPLPNGVYWLSVKAEGGSSSSAYVTVLRSGSRTLDAYAGPNPAGKGSRFVAIRWSPLSAAVDIKVFSLAGELTSDLGRAQGGKAIWNIGQTANGIYLISLKLAGERRPQFLKIAIAR